ncbi:WRKY transcription factor [Sarracenia purpurea var. burkii]
MGIFYNVQRCAEDMSILITTYEGTHNHPLPVSATAMASTTSAAASMLISGSYSSAATASFAANLQGLNFTVSDYSKTRPFYLPNSSSSHPFPTITLDLTSSSSSSSSTHFNNILSSSSRFPSTSLSFSSSEPNISPAVWGNGHLNYGSLLPYNKSNIGSFNLGRPSQDQGNYQPNYTDKNNQASSPSQQFLTETLTRAITSDPSFRSVIAAAISSMAGDGGGNQGNHGRGESFGQNLKQNEAIQVINSNPLTPKGKACASRYLNRSSSTLNPQTGSLMTVQQPPLPFSLSKNNSSSVGDSRDQTS